MYNAINTTIMAKLGSGKYAHIFNNKEALENLLKECSSARDVLNKLDASISSSSYLVLSRACLKHGLVAPNGRASSAAKGGIKLRKEADERLMDRLVDGDSYGFSSMKQRILRLGLLRNQCYGCGLLDTWNGNPITMELDHINGRHRDWRLENLRMLCPNCHSQEPTSRGANRGKNQNGPKKRVYIRKGRRHLRVFDPTKEHLESLIWTKPTSTLSKELGISDVLMTRRCKELGVSKPPRGYWEKLYHGKLGASSVP